MMVKSHILIKNDTKILGRIDIWVKLTYKLAKLSRPMKIISVLSGFRWRKLRDI